MHTVLRDEFVIVKKKKIVSPHLFTHKFSLVFVFVSIVFSVLFI